MPAWPGLGASLPVHPHSGRRAGPCQGWWQCQGAAAVGCAPNRSCWLLPKAVGRHTGAALPPAAAAQGHLRAEPARLWAGELGEGCGCQGPSLPPAPRAWPERAALASPASGKGPQSWALPGGPPVLPWLLSPHCAVGTPSQPSDRAASHRAHTGLQLLLGELHCPPRVLCQEQAQLGAQGARQEGRQKLCPRTAVPAMLAGIYLKVAKSSGVASALKNDLTLEGWQASTTVTPGVLWGSRE